MSELTERVQGEFENFRRAVIENKHPEDIFEMAYEICWRKEILQAIADMGFSDEQEKALLSTRGDLLFVLYCEWLQIPETSVEALGVMIENFSDELYEERKKNAI